MNYFFNQIIFFIISKRNDKFDKTCYTIPMAKTKTKHITKKQEKFEYKYMEQKTYETKELISIFGIVGCFLIIIAGLFTPMIKANGTYLTPINYFIKNGIDAISKAGSGLGVGLGATHYALVLASWLLAFISTTLLLAFWILKIVHFFRDRHSTFDYKKLNRWMCGFIIPYILVVCSTLLGLFPNDINCRIGYGTLIVFFGLIGILVFDSINSIEEIKDNLGIFVVEKVLTLFTISLPFWYGSVFSLYDGDTLLNTFSPYCLTWQLFAGGSDLLTGNPKLLLSAIFLLNISIVFIPLIVRAINNSTKIIFSSITFVMLTIGFILMQLYTKSGTNKALYISTTFYLLYIGVLAILFLAIALVIQNRPEKIKQN